MLNIITKKITYRRSFLLIPIGILIISASYIFSFMNFPWDAIIFFSVIIIFIIIVLLNKNKSNNDDIDFHLYDDDDRDDFFDFD